MTTAADRADERAFEAALAGRRAPTGARDGGGGIAAFTEAVRATATQPGRPSAALAELLANGLLVDQPTPSVRTAKRRRRRMWFFTAIIAKIASAGAVAQAATGAGLVLVGFTTAGATGVLPAPVQNTFDSVVHDVSGANPAGATTSSTPAATATPDPTDTSVTSSSAAPSETHAAVVSTGPSWKPEREDGEKNYGQAVSSAAHERNDERKAERTASATAARPTQPETSGDQDNEDHGSASAAKTRHGDD